MGFIRIVGRKPMPGDVWWPCNYCTAGQDARRQPVVTHREQPLGEGYYPSNLCPACEGAGGSWWPAMPTKEAKSA